MYDWPEVERANDAYWRRIADHLVGLVTTPRALTRGQPFDQIWQDPDLLLAQTCGLPFVSGRCGTAQVIARPDYGIEGATDGIYSSALICRRGAGARLADFRGAIAAINEYGSQSGCNALADAVGETDFFGAVLVTGAHRLSARAVAAGDADWRRSTQWPGTCFARTSPPRPVVCKCWTGHGRCPPCPSSPVPPGSGWRPVSARRLAPPAAAAPAYLPRFYRRRTPTICRSGRWLMRLPAGNLPPAPVRSDLLHLRVASTCRIVEPD